MEVSGLEALIQFKGSDSRVKVPLNDSSRLRPLQEAWDEEDEEATPVVDGIVVDGTPLHCVFVRRLVYVCVL